MSFRGENYLGIDWGETKIGVALAHPETRVALSLGILKNDASLLNQLALLLIRENIGTIIIGVPHYLSISKKGNVPSSESKKKHPAFDFGEMLRQQLGIAVEYHDEMFTTKMAQAKLIEGEKRKVSQQDDAEAARLLLESWLTSRD